MAPNPIYPGNGLEIDFLGLPMVFNDGKAENTLQIALTNNNFFGSLQPEHDSTIVFNQDTPISLWFVVDVAQGSAGPQRHWALTSYDALHDAKVALTVTPGKWSISRSDDLSGNPLNDSLNGWQLVAVEDVTLLPGQSLVLTLCGFKSASPDGPASAYVQVDIPHLDEYGEEALHLTKVIGPITKSRVMITGERMGIGTGSPNSALEVNGAVRARGRKPGELSVNNLGFFFNGVGNAASGMTSIENGDLMLFINDLYALNIEQTPADGTSGQNIRATLTGNLLMQGNPPPVLLEVEGDGHFSGNLKSEGRIEDHWGLLIPVGTIVAYIGSEPPPGWLWCAGQEIPFGGEFDELRNMIGDRLPDLRQRFIAGAGFDYAAGKGTAYGAIPEIFEGGLVGMRVLDYYALTYMIKY